MKKFSIFAAVLVLTLSVFTGCGCRRQVPETVPPTDATMMPPIATTEAMTEATTEHTTAATEHTQGTEDRSTVPDGVDPDNNTAVTDGTMEGRARNRSGMGK